YDYCIAVPGGYYTGWADEDDYDAHEEAIAIEMALLGLAHPEWSSLRLRLTAEYNAVSDALHTILDIAGLVEGLGLPADVLNGIFYAIEGNGTDALISFGGALPGGFIVTASRSLRKAVDIAGTTRTFTWTQKGANIVFNQKGQYRKIWKGVYSELDDAAYIAHHVIPQAKWNHPLVQKAARANPDNLPSGVDPFHMHMPSNGWPVHQSRHTSNHSDYSNRIENKMTQWMNDNPGASSEEAATALAQWQTLLKNAMGQGSTGPNINDITLPDFP
ncbi:MAG: AHH domain-containing protein, partial [Bacteroidota bacterium]